MSDNLHVVGKGVTKDELIVGNQRLESVCLFDLKFACLYKCVGSHCPFFHPRFADDLRLIQM